MREEQPVAPAFASDGKTSGRRPCDDSLPATPTKIATRYRKMIDAPSGDAAVSNDELYERIEHEEYERMEFEKMEFEEVDE